MENSWNNRVLSFWKMVKTNWSNKMLTSYVERRESLPGESTKRRKILTDELIESTETLPDELIERRESLPDELIEEILSWLPVKSAVKFNSVCKLFHTIIQDQKFILKHMHHAKIDITSVIPADSNNAPLRVLTRINGLILERQNPSRIYQIRNHATNRILELPGLKENVISCNLCHILPTNEYKVLNVYKEGHSGIAMEVLTVGTDITWRPIRIPVSFDWRKNKVTTRTSVEGINYTVEFSKPDIKQSKMIAFKLEDETFMEILMPQELLFSSESEFWAMQWEQMISLICRFKDGLRVWVLDNSGKSSKWIEKKLVFKSHATDQDEDRSILKIAQPRYAIKEKLVLQLVDPSMEIVYDIKSMRIVKKGPNLTWIIENKNTLVSFRGMH